MAANQLVDELKLLKDDKIPKNPCLGCVSGKMKRLPFPVGNTRKNKVRQLIHTDICGPMHVTTLGGGRYFLLFTDDCSNTKRSIFLNKNQKPQILLRSMSTYCEVKPAI